MKYKKILQTDIKSNYTNAKSNTLSSYMMFDKRLINVGDSLKFHLYINDYVTHMSLYLQSNTVIDKKHKNSLMEVERLYVNKEQKGEYEHFIEKKLQDTIESELLSIEDKRDIIYTSTSELTNSLYEDPNALENVQRSKNIVKPILQSIIYDDKAIKSFMKIIEYDYYTHTHSLNVSIYSLCLGSELGLSQTTLNALGCSALLHDLGKSSIDRKIVNKTGLLSHFEFDKMKRHPTLGYETALKIGITDKNILDGIRHHHEKLNGMGYPDGLKGKEITLFARIIGICDIFDALTTRRSYKSALNSYDAIYLMKTHMYKHLDMEIVNTFIKMLHN
ncbi:hypothetical protein M947_04800 [Sulfurimonas hongkongensis]|uniref:HD-GYP domain-containing protein n=1 Tax=Sulfurimonas hongkongensis TaxID=1172190 RepID=T0L268_9BACT|nr:HD domain-containing phosphohydrolase [Sulfurimonas hongkongensis]EQB39903.1 hypothetical protein M947_04800 [Sulfurimonas hongkongensis]